MSIKGVTFDMQSPTAKNHGALFAGILSDGIVSGCAVTVSGKSCYIGAGYLIAAGRLVQLTARETVAIAATSGSVTIVLNIDLTKTATKDEFGQAYFSVVSGASPELTQDDVNDNGTLYQMPVATLTCTASSLTVADTCGIAHGRMMGTVYDSVPTDLSDFVEGEVILVAK